MKRIMKLGFAVVLVVLAICALGVVEEELVVYAPRRPELEVMLAIDAQQCPS